MARISYVHPDDVTDPEMKEWLAPAIETGRPGPENHAKFIEKEDARRAAQQLDASHV